MIVVFLLLKNFNFSLLLTLLIGTCAYCVFATGLTIHTLGGGSISVLKVAQTDNNPLR